jgi:hypothetical protein
MKENRVALRLLWYANLLNVYLLKNLRPAALQEFFANSLAEPLRIIAAARLPQKQSSIWTRNHRFKLQLTLTPSCVCANRHLTASAQLSKQGPLAVGFRTRSLIIKKPKRISYRCIACANLNSQRALARCGAHFLGRNNLPH